jgi:hypothetical protein
MSRRRVTLALLLVALAGGPAAAAPVSPLPPKEKSMFFGQPVLSLKLELQDCSYCVYVNGGLVACDRSAMPADEEHPINHLLRGGDNQIELRLFKQADGGDPAGAKLGDETSATVELRVKQNGKPADPEPVTRISYVLAKPEAARTEGSSRAGRFDSVRKLAASDTGDVEVGPVQVVPMPRAVGVAVRRSIKLPLPFRPWAFLRSDKIDDPMAAPRDQLMKVYHELVAAYQAVWTPLHAGEVDKVLDMFEERSSEIDAATYKPAGSTRKRLRELLVKAMNDKDLALAPITLPEGRYWTLEIGPTGTLLGLVRGDRAGAILRFSEKGDDAALSTVFPVFFRRERGRYIITR